MDKKTFYVSVPAGDVLEASINPPQGFTIEASDEEMNQLESLFHQRDQADWGSFLRAHVPIMPYHLDKNNDQYDANMHAIYHMIYNLGNEQTKRDMENMGYFQ